MNATGAYFQLTDLMGLYSNRLSLGQSRGLSALFTVDGTLRLPDGTVLCGEQQLEDYFALQDQRAAEGMGEFLAVFGQLIEVNPNQTEARCLWMFLSVQTQLDSTALHQIGRMDLECVKVGDVFRIRQMKQLVRTRLEPIPIAARPGGEGYLPPLELPTALADDPALSDALDILNLQSRYEQYLHYGDWDSVSELFSNREDATWTVGNTRKRYLANHPEYVPEPDGPADSAEPPWWMGAKVGHEAIMHEGFAGMTAPFAPENQGLYCSSDMLNALVVVNRETGRAYTSSPSYGGFIIGPGLGMEAPYPTLNAFGRWHIEWIWEEGRWKMYHFFWSTFYEVPIDRYDPSHRADWLSTHSDVHNWPVLPEAWDERREARGKIRE